MKILIADDHTLFRDAIVAYMKRVDEDTQVVLAEDYYQTREHLSEDSDFDLTLLDLKMPGMNGLEGLRQIRQDFPDMRVALLSGVAEKDHVIQAMEIGAHGFFPKTLSGKSLMKAIELVVAGERFLPIDHEKNTIQPAYYNGDTVSSGFGFEETSQNEYIGGDFPQLTKRETEVLGYLVKGASNKEIARALDLQIVTIKLHVRGICRKLNAKNRTQAALKAQKIGIA